ncbi:MAG TPA: hypothetical protein VNV66_20050 [Pilimelia sp.]|nr:hypothetical protein [Pilimelia sp.]
MALIRPAALWLGAAMSAPALYRGFVTEDLEVASALGRFLVAVAVAAVMLAGLRFLTADYGRRGVPARRRTDPQPEAVEGDPPTARPDAAR